MSQRPVLLVLRSDPIREPGFGSMVDAVRDVIAIGDIEGACGVLRPDGNVEDAD
jgi:hypothetical protein